MTEYERGYENAIKDAAYACFEQMMGFLSPQYATGQPLSSFQERFACQECRSAVLALIQKDAKDD